MVFSYTKNEAGEFVCQHCNIVKKNQNTMHYHLRKHEGALPHVCPVKECPMKFLQKGMLDLHISARHPDRKEAKEKPAEVYDCPCCSFTSMTKANRRIHFARIHLKDLTEALKVKNNETNPTCTECNKDFKSLTAFYYHTWNCMKLSPNHEFYNDFLKI